MATHGVIFGPVHTATQAARVAVIHANIRTGHGANPKLPPAHIGHGGHVGGTNGQQKVTLEKIGIAAGIPVTGVGGTIGIPRTDIALPGILVVKLIGKATQLPPPKPQENPLAIFCARFSISVSAREEKPRERIREEGSRLAEKRDHREREAPSPMPL